MLTPHFKALFSCPCPFLVLSSTLPRELGDLSDGQPRVCSRSHDRRRVSETRGHRNLLQHLWEVGHISPNTLKRASPLSAVGTTREHDLETERHLMERVETPTSGREEETTYVSGFLLHCFVCNRKPVSSQTVNWS